MDAAEMQHQSQSGDSIANARTARRGRQQRATRGDTTTTCKRRATYDQSCCMGDGVDGVELSVERGCRQIGVCTGDENKRVEKRRKESSKVGGRAAFKQSGRGEGALDQ